MFNNRFTTKIISEEVPIYLQNILWYLLDTMEIDKKDYLQVFELKLTVDNSTTKQVIIHRQEMPNYYMEYAFNVTTAYEGKIFIIDDGNSTTILASADY